MRPALIGGVVRAGQHPLRSNINNDNNTHNLENTGVPNATPTRPRPSKSALRPALQSRDNNAKMRVPPNMKSYEKQTTNRPLLPTLSASAKTGGRTPLTPRVAGAPRATTPASRRTARAETPAEEISTPVSAFLNNNVTPRSGSRKSRVDSTNTTPTGTPNGTPTLASPELFRTLDTPAYGNGLGFNADKDVKRPTVTFSPTVSDVGQAKNQAQGNGDSKFFFASEAKTTQPTRPPLPTKSSSTFFYANGESIPPPPQSSSGSAVGSMVGEEKSQPRFFHANGTPDVDAPHYLPPRPSSVVSTGSRNNSPRIGTSASSFSPSPRPTSPSKLNQFISPMQNAAVPSLSSPILPRPQGQGRGQSSSSIISARRGSIDAGKRVISHGSSSSISSSDGRKISFGSTISPPSTPLHVVTSSVPISTPEETSKPEHVPELQSPIKTGHSLEQLNELAANARRERKVLDLEITNSSLAAINRTLEREMRKQTAELRRYRRLSRSGRLSIATSASVRTSSGSMSLLDGSQPSLSDISDEEENEEDEESEDEEDDSSEEGSLSPSAMAESDLRHRKRDEKRLQLDLSKHQQLLIDSQKMNQSLKRCLGLTEDLIGEGKKALAYKVMVTDVSLGGRVLLPEEMEGAEHVDDGEGMSEMGKEMLREARIAAASNAVEREISMAREMGAWGEEVGDRDSGIEVDAKQKGLLAVSPLRAGFEPE